MLITFNAEMSAFLAQYRKQVFGKCRNENLTILIINMQGEPERCAVSKPEAWCAP